MVRHLRQSLRVPTADNEEETAPFKDLAQVSSANSRAALARIVEEDPEEDLAAAAVAEVETVAVMALATKSMTSTARPGTTAATDASWLKPRNPPLRRRRP